MSLIGVAAVAVAGALGGCGGSLFPHDGGAAGSRGAAGTGGTAGTTGVAGTTGGAGTTGEAGTTGTTGAAGTSGGSFGEPACLSTVVKGGACTPLDQQFCYKTCGPEATGVKAETCTTGGVYAEMSGCSFDPSRDYSCYKISSEASIACAAGVTPQAGAPCDIPPCSVCNSLRGTVGGQYVDSAGAPKVGWCVCRAANAAGVRAWSCASDTSWPCPLGAGC